MAKQQVKQNLKYENKNNLFFTISQHNRFVYFSMRYGRPHTERTKIMSTLLLGYVNIRNMQMSDENKCQFEIMYVLLY